MNRFTTAIAWSVTAGSGGGGGAVATHSPARTKAKVVELGAHVGWLKVPAASCVRPVPSGRTANRPVSLPRRISFFADQLTSAAASEVTVLPARSVITPL